MLARLIRIIGAAFLTVGLAVAPATSEAQVNIVDLGRQADTSTPIGLNNSGQIAFAANLYSGGTLTPLGSLPGSTNVVATGINAAGQVIGNVYHAAAICGSFPSDTTPVLVANGTVTPLTAAVDCSLITPRAVGNAINASGQTVGSGAYGPSETNLCWILTSGTPTVLQPPSNQFGGELLGGFACSATGISDSGLVTGTALNTIPIMLEDDAFLYNNGVWTNLGAGSGSAVNSAGQVTGFLVVNNQNHAFLYGAGATTDLNRWLNAISSQGSSINATGQIVGNYTSGAGAIGGFFFNGTVTDINQLVASTDPLKSRVTLIGAVALNDNRLILAIGTDSQDMSTHSYLVQGPWIDFAPGLLAFASEAIGAVSADQTVNVTNSGTASAAVNSAVISGDFVTHANTCGASLPAGGTCAISVAFASSGSGDRSGSLTLSLDGVPFAVPLLGVSPITVSLTASATSVPMNSPVTLTWKISSGATCAATGGVDGDGWTGSFTSNGTQAVTEATPGARTYGLSCTAGSQTAQASVVVNDTALPVTVTVSSSPMSFTAGQSITLTWQSTNATSCTGTGGGASDGWPDAKATSGSQTITEPYAPAGASLSISFTVTCTSSLTSLSNSASVTVTENAVVPKQGGSGGGGDLDAWSLAALCLVIARRARRGVAARQSRLR